MAGLVGDELEQHEAQAAVAEDPAAAATGAQAAGRAAFMTAAAEPVVVFRAVDAVYKMSEMAHEG